MAFSISFVARRNNGKVLDIFLLEKYNHANEDSTPIYHKSKNEKSFIYIPSPQGFHVSDRIKYIFTFLTTEGPSK